MSALRSFWTRATRKASTGNWKPVCSVPTFKTVAKKVDVLSADAFRAAVLSESRPGSRPEDVDRSMAALLTGMDSDTVATVLSLQGRYPLYLLSNNNPISMVECRRILRENGLGDAFKAEFISADMKLMKPSRAFYEEVVRRLGVPAGEIVFVDDSPANVEGARAVGIDARLYVPGTPLAPVLSDL